MNTINPLCFCSLEIESVTNYLLRCQFYSAIRSDLMNELRIIDKNITSLNESDLVNLLLYGCIKKYNTDINTRILNSGINYIKSLK